MKKQILGLFLAGAMLLTACGTANHTETTPEQTTEGETKQAADAPSSFTGKTRDVNPGSDISTPLAEGDIRAMALTDPDGSFYFVDINIGTFFTAPIPDTFTDASGASLTEVSLGAGDIVDISGNGIMLESYPGQYPGVTKMVRVKDGEPSDAAIYQELIDQVYGPEDPGELPFMNAEYTTDLAVTTVVLTSGNYEWTYTDENGQGQSVVACGSHILEWDILNDARLPEGTQVRLTSSRLPDSVTVTRWPSALWKGNTGETDNSAAENGALPLTETAENGSYVPGEAVPAEKTDDAFVLTADPGYVYLIEAVWPEGTVEFGFYTL